MGYAAYDVVRFFEKLPLPAGRDSGVPALHYVAPRSLLVFDHLTRGIALLHDGSQEDRRSLRKEVVRALRGGLPNGPRAGRYARPQPAFSRDDYLAGVSGRRNTLPRAMSISSYYQRDFRDITNWTRSRRIGHCV